MGKDIRNTEGESYLEEKMKAIDKAEEGPSGISKKSLFGIILAFTVLFIIHFGPAIPGLRPTRKRSNNSSIRHNIHAYSTHDLLHNH